MNDELSKYERMKDSGSSPEDVYREASRDGVDPIARILRESRVEPGGRWI